jgi:hypothetical protein
MRPIQIGAAALALSLFLPAVSLAASWTGEEVDVDGVTHVLNPADPLLPPTEVPLTEMWRLGGYSDAPEEFFGVISDIVADEQNHFYVLDAQLSEVRIFDQSGMYLRTIGREGEGPGEFRRPSDLNLMPDGSVSVIQAWPSKMVLLTPDGIPAGNFEITPRGEGFPGLSAATTVGDNVAMVYSVSNPDREAGEFRRTTRLGIFDMSGAEVADLVHATSAMQFNDQRLVETDWNNFERAWSASREGTVAARTEFTDYRIDVWNADGTPRHVIRREYAPHARDDAAVERIKARWGAMIRRWVQNPEYDIEPHWNPIESVHAREDGTIWVRTSRGTYDRPEGALATFDVFDAQGRFERQVSMQGEFDPVNDGMFLAGGYLLVVTDLMSARQAFMGGGPDEGMADADPMEIICYRMELAPLARAD